MKMHVVVAAAACALALAWWVGHGARAAPGAPIASATLAPLAPAHPKPAARPAGAVVYVVGAVAHAGVYALPAGKRIVDALQAAGGAAARADLVAINLAEPLSDGERIVVPAQGEQPARERPRSARRANAQPGARSPRRSTRKRPPEQPIDLNAADARELATLPGVGPGLAQRIVDFREANGRFQSLDELNDVAGLSPRRVDEIAPYLTLR